MELIYKTVLILVFTNMAASSCHTASTNGSQPGQLTHEGTESDVGCGLQAPQSVQKHWEAHGEPLLISIDMKVLNLRDVPDSGGSFQVDIK